MPFISAMFGFALLHVTSRRSKLIESMYGSICIISTRVHVDNLITLVDLLWLNNLTSLRFHHLNILHNW